MYLFQPVDKVAFQIAQVVMKFATIAVARKELVEPSD